MARYETTYEAWPKDATLKTDTGTGVGFWFSGSFEKKEDALVEIGRVAYDAAGGHPYMPSGAYRARTAYLKEGKRRVKTGEAKVLKQVIDNA